MENVKMIRLTKTQRKLHRNGILADKLLTPTKSGAMIAGYEKINNLMSKVTHKVS